METFSAVDEAKWGGRWPSTPQAQGLIPSTDLKWDGGNAQDYDPVLYPEVEAGGSEPQDYLQPQQAQGTPELHETLSQNNKRKLRSLLKWKPSFVSMVVEI